MKKPTSIDEYIASFPKEMQDILQRVRETIKKELPGAKEIIGYAIPAFRLNDRNVLYFAGWKTHIAMYPIPVGDAAFTKEITPFITGKGTVQFRLNKPIPYDVIRLFAQGALKSNIDRYKK